MGSNGLIFVWYDVFEVEYRSKYLDSYDVNIFLDFIYVGLKKLIDMIDI